MHYLVAVDGSEPSDRALDHAVMLSTALDASLTIVHAVEPNAVEENADGDDSLYTEDPDDAEARGERVVADATERAVEDGVDAEAVLLYGDAVETIAAYATENGVDGIVVGHRGLSDRVEGMVGSVAKRLVANAAVPVTVVR
ncbi:universal stress protein [Halogeometricum sp. S1BR25-6]|uniref:Universal stress protein n=1 Tax=Halogeometricum salsisoli TaxID=2950536 RepID=A0ABU2GA77_9EURY|nr:universal stress protein [Halogeometricum sp. S1BR25-6]MDS0297682.1 universal stress protein [Halogeometricum sp. S1BR25-6]